MRVGMNPQKKENKLLLKTNHRVIIVVFIPSLEGYYQSVFEVLKLNLQSLIATKNEFCELTVVNNGSCKIVLDYLNEMFLDKKIDSVIHHNTNIGKIDALIGAARTARENLITLTDIDILFVNGWQEKVEEIFNSFKNVGSVSPIPTRNSHTYGTISTLNKILLKRVNFSFESIKENLEAQNKFFESFGWEKETDENLKWPVLKNNDVKAVLGSNHQVLTIRKDILFKYVPTKPSLTLVGNQSEYNYVDLPIDLSGKMRLSTYNNYAFHMGNKVEDWMIEVQKNNESIPFNKNNSSNKFEIEEANKNKINRIYYKINKKFVKKIFKLLYKN